MLMRKLRRLSLVIALALVATACDGNGPEDTTTTTVTNGSTTTLDPTVGYPWIVLTKTPTGQANQIDPELNGIGFLNGETHQVQCLGCGTASNNDVTSKGEGIEVCDYAVRYVPNQLIVQGDFDQFDAMDITPQLLADPEDRDTFYELPDGFRLYKIDRDPIDALVALGSGVVASPNYIYLSAPSWRFSPADNPIPVDSKGLMSAPIFEKGKVIVIDDFTSGSGHGQFIVSIIEQLNGQTPTKFYDVQLLDNATGQNWAHPSDTLSIAATIQAAVAFDSEAVINLSMGTYGCTSGGLEIPPVLVIAEIINSDATVVAAAGNDNHQGGDPIFYPAGHNGVVGVGALGWSKVDSEWYAADFSNMNAVNRWAPGVAIVAHNGTEVVAWSGTSFAAPHFAACLASVEC